MKKAVLRKKLTHAYAEIGKLRSKLGRGRSNKVSESDSDSSDTSSSSGSGSGSDESVDWVIDEEGDMMSTSPSEFKSVLKSFGTELMSKLETMLEEKILKAVEAARKRERKTNLKKDGTPFGKWRPGGPGRRPAPKNLYKYGLEVQEVEEEAQPEDAEADEAQPEDEADADEEAQPEEAEEADEAQPEEAEEEDEEAQPEEAEAEDEAQPEAEEAEDEAQPAEAEAEAEAPMCSLAPPKLSEEEEAEYEEAYQAELRVMEKEKKAKRKLEESSVPSSKKSKLRKEVKKSSNAGDLMNAYISDLLWKAKGKPSRDMSFEHEAARDPKMLALKQTELQHKIESRFWEPFQLAMDEYKYFLCPEFGRLREAWSKLDFASNMVGTATELQYDADTHPEVGAEFKKAQYEHWYKLQQKADSAYEKVYKSITKKLRGFAECQAAVKKHLTDLAMNVYKMEFGLHSDEAEDEATDKIGQILTADDEWASFWPEVRVETKRGTFVYKGGKSL